MRGTREQATQILAGALYQSGKVNEAMTVLDYASRWYVRADQWLTYGGIAYAAMDNPRTVRAYQLAYQLDPDAFDPTQLNAYAGVLDEVRRLQDRRAIRPPVRAVAMICVADRAWNHLAARPGMDRFDSREARREASRRPPRRTPGFAAPLERAKTKTKTAPPAPTVPAK